MIAANSASSSSYDVRISAWIVGSTARTVRHTSIPEPSGSRASSTATCGRSAGIRAVASSADAGLADHLDVAGALQEGAQTLPHDLVVVEQVHADLVVSHVSGCTSPRSITRSTRSRPASAWVIQTTVRPSPLSRTSAASASAVAPSRCAAGSSSTSTGWSASSDRAIAIRARSPPETSACPSPSQLSRPSGSASSQRAQPGLAQRRLDLQVGGARSGQPDVLAQRRGEDVRVVVDQPDGASYVVERELRQRPAAQGHLAADRVDEAQQQRRERALARTRSGRRRRPARPRRGPGRGRAAPPGRPRRRPPRRAASAEPVGAGSGRSGSATTGGREASSASRSSAARVRAASAPASASERADLAQRQRQQHQQREHRPGHLAGQQQGRRSDAETRADEHERPGRSPARWRRRPCAGRGRR